MKERAFKGTSEIFSFETMPNDLKQFLLGSLLGDGCFTLNQKGSVNCHLVIAHSMKQEEYIKCKLDLLNKYDLVSSFKKRTTIDKRFKIPEYTEIYLKSKQNPIFTYIRLKSYKQNKKGINMEIIKDLDELGLAIWYMDDGYVTKNSCIFSTCSFPIEQQRKLAKFLKNRFKLHFTVGKNDNSLYLRSKDFPKFVALISSYIIPSMQYKIVPYSKRVLYKSDKLLEHPNGTISSQATQGCVEGSETNSIPLEQ